MDLTLPDELTMLRETVRGYVDRYLRPLEKTVEETDHLDNEVFLDLRRKAAGLGLYAHNIPESLGGGGLSTLGQVVIGEEIGRTSMPLADAIGFLPATICLASQEQREWFLDPIVSGELTVAYALTEPDAGSDLGQLRLRGRQTNKGWVLNGNKHYISGADYADYIMVLAVTDPDAKLRNRFTIFIVERSNPGYHYLRNIRKMGWRGYQLGAFALDDCIVPPSHVLGRVGGGFDAIMDTINTTRIEYAGRYVGMADELLRLGLDYVQGRTAFGQKLSEFQATQFQLADCDCEIEASRLLAYRAATLADANDPAMRIAGSRAKLYASEMVGRVADRVLQMYGGAGYMCDYPIERMYRDARAYRIGEGTSEMQRLQIARALLAR